MHQAASFQPPAPPTPRLPSGLLGSADGGSSTTEVALGTLTGRLKYSLKAFSRRVAQSLNFKANDDSPPGRCARALTLHPGTLPYTLPRPENPRPTMSAPPVAPFSFAFKCVCWVGGIFCRVTNVFHYSACRPYIPVYHYSAYKPYMYYHSAYTPYLSWSEVCSARVTSLLLLSLHTFYVSVSLQWSQPTREVRTHAR